MKTWNRLLSAFLACFMLTVLISASAFAANTDDGSLRITVTKVTSNTSGTSVALDCDNRSGTVISFGWTSCNLTVKTSEGTYETNICGLQDKDRIQAGSSSFLFNVPDCKGTVETITIESLEPLDERGLPVQNIIENFEIYNAAKNINFGTCTIAGQTGSSAGSTSVQPEVSEQAAADQKTFDEQAAANKKAYDEQVAANQEATQKEYEKNVAAMKKQAAKDNVVDILGLVAVVAVILVIAELRNRRSKKPFMPYKSNITPPADGASGNVAGQQVQSGYSAEQDGFTPPPRNDK